MQVGTVSVWMTENIFSVEALRGIVTTPLTLQSRREGREGFTLMDIIERAKLPGRRGQAQRFIDPDGVTPRERETRWDVKLTPLWVETMRTVNVAFAEACSLAEGVRSMNPKCKRAKIEWHVMIVHPGSPDQTLHMDDAASLGKGKRCYYTLIVPLTGHENSGGTHFPVMSNTFASLGGALVFDGSVLHAGKGNRSKFDRLFLYAAIFTGADRN